jgi:hypothetical protein
MRCIELESLGAVGSRVAIHEEDLAPAAGSRKLLSPGPEASLHPLSPLVLSAHPEDLPLREVESIVSLEMREIQRHRCLCPQNNRTFHSFPSHLRHRN